MISSSSLTIKSVATSSPSTNNTTSDKSSSASNPLNSKVNDLTIASSLSVVSSTEKSAKSSTSPTVTFPVNLEASTSTEAELVASITPKETEAI